MTPPLLAILLFCIGLIGVCTRRNILTVLLSLELMMNAVSLLFVYFGAALPEARGQILMLFLILFAAAEVALGLSIVLVAYKKKSTTDIDSFQEMKW